MVLLSVVSCTRQPSFDPSAGVLLQGRIRVKTTSEAQIFNVEALLWTDNKALIRLKHPFSSKSLWEARSDGNTLWINPKDNEELKELLNGLELQVLLSGIPPVTSKREANHWGSTEPFEYREQLRPDGLLSSWQRWQNNKPVLIVDYLAYQTIAKGTSLPKRISIKISAAQLEALLVFSSYKSAYQIPLPFIPNR